MLLYPLSDEKRDIVLLSYLLDMTDQEIANKLNIVRRTVQYKRTNSLKEMKRRMEVLEYGKKFD
jgi:DNA-directed RNA polymerase specialized sigma24 family protein